MRRNLKRAHPGRGGSAIRLRGARPVLGRQSWALDSTSHASQLATRTHDHARSREHLWREGSCQRVKRPSY